MPRKVSYNTILKQILNAPTHPIILEIKLSIIH